MTRRKTLTGLRGLVARSLVLYLACAMLAGPVLAQEAAKPAAGDAEESPVLKFKDAPLEMVMDFYSRLTGRTLLWAPTVQKNITVTLQNQTELTTAEALEAIETVLSMHSVALVREGEKFLRVIKSDVARLEPMPILEQLPDEDKRPLPDSSELISKMLILKYITLAEAEVAVKPLMHSYGKIAKFERINGVLLTDTAANVNRIQKVFSLIDQPVERREAPHVIQIRHAKAADIRKKLEEIIAETQKEAQQQQKRVPTANRSGSPGITSRRIPGVIRAPKPAEPTVNNVVDILRTLDEAERGIIRGKVQIVADERTNILIVITRPENMTFFEMIINALDVPTEPDVVVKIMRLDYADAETVATTINSLIGTKKDPKSAATPAKGDAKPAESAALRDYVSQLQQRANAAAAGKTNVGELSADNVKILSDKRTNSLIIMARKADYAALEEIVQAMDMMLSQVMIEVVIIQVDLDDEVSSGIHWVQRALMINDEKQDGSTETIGAVAGSMGAGSGDLMPTMQGAATLTDLGSWGAGTGLTAYFTHFGLNLDAIVRLVKTDTRTQIMSAPIITTTDNTKATLTSNQQKYFLKGNTVDQFGNVRPETEIKDIGLTLEVTPHINASRNVMMEVMQEASDPGADQQIEGQGSWPTTTKRTFTANISVQDRETIVLGGLVRNFTKQESTKVPLLGDIPLLGRLFSYKSNNKTRAEVVVFITPYVLDSNDEIAEESRRRRDALNIEGLWKRGWSDSELADGEPREGTAPRQEQLDAVRQQVRAEEDSSSAVEPTEVPSTPEDDEAPTPVPVPEETPVPSAPVNEAARESSAVPMKEVDPDLADFIRESERKWGRSLKRVDKTIDEQMRRLREG